MSSFNQTPPVGGEDGQDESSLTLYGKTFTESEFLRARRHNAFRTTACLLIGVPIVFGVWWYYGTLAALFVGAVFVPGIYPVATRFFPAAAKHGTMIYKKYSDHRNHLRYKAENS